MSKKFAYPLIISLATLTAAGGLAACNDNGSAMNQPSPAATNPNTGNPTSARSALPDGNPGSANPGGGGQGNGQGGSR